MRFYRVRLLIPARCGGIARGRRRRPIGFDDDNCWDCERPHPDARPGGGGDHDDPQEYPKEVVVFDYDVARHRNTTLGRVFKQIS